MGAKTAAERLHTLYVDELQQSLLINDNNFLPVADDAIGRFVAPPRVV